MIERHLSRILFIEFENGKIEQFDFCILSLSIGISGKISDYKISKFLNESPCVIYHDNPIKLIVKNCGDIVFLEIFDNENLSISI